VILMGILRPCFCVIAAEADQTDTITDFPISIAEEREITITVEENQKVLLNGFASVVGTSEIGDPSNLRFGELAISLTRISTTEAVQLAQAFESIEETSSIERWAANTSLSWLDSPSPGTYTYRLIITSLFTRFDNNIPIINNLRTRGLNALVFQVGN
jgi:hypothetical protein